MADRPPQFGAWIHDKPFDSADYLDHPDRESISEDDKTGMAKVRKYEQTLKGRGVLLLTPTFPEIFDSPDESGEDDGEAE